MSDNKRCFLRAMDAMTMPRAVKPRYSWSCACGETESGIVIKNIPVWEGAYQSYLAHRAGDRVSREEFRTNGRNRENVFTCVSCQKEITGNEHLIRRKSTMEEIGPFCLPCKDGIIHQASTVAEKIVNATAANASECCGQKQGKICGDCPNLTIPFK